MCGIPIKNLRLLLTRSMGITSFNHLRTVNGVECKTFKEACQQLGLLKNERYGMLLYISDTNASVLATTFRFRLFLRRTT
ncbi:ATP-dependent DNA helicase PIF1 [Biomphalaria glabrata]|nr:ATP-dependent DNA helicase PIF1; partial [Biomphalaria glabrata]